LPLLLRFALWRPELLRRLDALVLRALELRPPLDALRPLELRPLDALRPLELRPLDALRPLELRPLPLLRVLPLRLPLLRPLPLLRVLPLRLPLLRPLPLLRVLPLPLLRLLPLLALDSLAFWFRVRPRDDACRLLPLLALLDEPRLLERLEEPRPLVADIVHLLLFDSHVQTNSAGAGLGWLYPANLAITTQPGQMFDALHDALLDG
jgi:hypothetical protein